MTQELDPIATTAHLSATYRRYLKTVFPLRDRSLRDQYHAAIDESEAVTRGPLLEAQPPFLHGHSLAQLIEEGVVSREFLRLDSDVLPLHRPLYRHQERAVRMVVQDKRNIVVATGTGSGKTESFLLPVLDYLLREYESGTLSNPGVRALLLYPMNALANDQRKRLRQVLATFPEITFGRYTGESVENRGKALELFRAQNPGQPVAPNELLSREEMRARPPHLLLTNYAMLEYLLLRPRDSEFFDGATASSWRFLILDEAHVYSGANGIEMAMLLRRLKERISHSSPGPFRCIATSATLGRGRPDYPAVASYASELFGESFVFSADRANEQDVIEAERQPLRESGYRTVNYPTELYLQMHQRARGDVTATASDLRSVLATFGINDPAPDKALEMDAWLYELLVNDRRLHSLREMLSLGPTPLETAATSIFPDIVECESALTALVALAVRARTGPEALALLPARYHFFARALEGTYVCLAPHTTSDGPRLFLARQEWCPDCANANARRRVFELAACTQCGADYLVGSVEVRADGRFLLSSSTSAGEHPVSFFLVDDAISGDEDEDTATDEDGSESDGALSLCIACGRLEESSDSPGCACGAALTVPLVMAELKPDQPELRRCLACGIRSNREIVSRFLTGQDAPVGVLATAVYESLPPSSDQAAAQKPGGGRKLLVFADSRQDAAFFAPYLESNFGRLQRRSLLVRTLQESTEACRGDLRIQDIAGIMQSFAAEAGMFSPEQSRYERERMALLWLMQEFISWDRRNSPEGVGLTAFRPAKPAKWTAPEALLRAPWNLSAEDAYTIIEMLLDSLRRQGASSFPDGVSPNNEVFAPRARAIYARGSGSDGKAGVLSFEPMARKNGRSEFLVRLLERTAPQMTSDQRDAEVRTVLRGVWKHLTDPNGPWALHLPIQQVPRIGAVFRLNYAMWEVVPGDHDSVAWHRCSSCGILSQHEVHGVCPTNGCRGILLQLEASVLDSDDNHYRAVYSSMLPTTLRSEEHTAQWTSDEAARIQEEFINGTVNVLSCSTTFELGVDVGDLQAVMMRNVPPTTANYVQRAGRAGRRTDAAAYVTTFAQRRSHDLTMYRKPERLVAGRIPSPVITLTNEKIVRRHVHSIAFAAFFRWAVDEFGLAFPGKVGTFFAPENGSTGPDLLDEFLDAHPANVATAISRVVPLALHNELGVDAWNWSSELRRGAFAVARAEVEADVELFAERIKDAIAQEDYRSAERFRRMCATVLGRELLGFLASRNVLPKYGFPVDVVELQTRYVPASEAQRLDLTRDLRIALSEYAPGSELVAGGRVWTGGGLNLRPGWQAGSGAKVWDEYAYAVCPNCMRFNERHLSDTPPEFCAQCGGSLASGYHRMRGIYVKPEFGFIAKPEEPKRSGDGRPKRSYSSRVFFADFSGQDIAHDRIDLSQPDRPFQVTFARGGRLAVVNPGAGGAGFRLCEKCGFGEQAPRLTAGQSLKHKAHKDPRTGRQCGGKLRNLHLGHTFHTDVLAIGLPFDQAAPQAARLSLLYALLEGASEALGISRGDLDGVVFGQTPLPEVLIYDNVPGGAGHARRIGEEFDQVLRSAWEKVDTCECGVETSCYECLRTYGNQPYHDQLTRQAAKGILHQLTVP